MKPSRANKNKNLSLVTSIIGKNRAKLIEYKDALEKQVDSYHQKLSRLSKNYSEFNESYKRHKHAYSVSGDKLDSETREILSMVIEIGAETLSNLEEEMDQTTQNHQECSSNLNKATNLLMKIELNESLENIRRGKVNRSRELVPNSPNLDSSQELLKELERSVNLLGHSVKAYQEISR